MNYLELKTWDSEHSSVWKEIVSRFGQSDYDNKTKRTKHIATLKAEWEAKAYARSRATEYPTIANQLDEPMLIPNEINLFNEIKKFPEKHNTKYKPNLSEEALLTFETGNGIKLSHYNLLVNANSIQKALNIKSRTKIYCNLEPNTSAWAVFKAILPIYSGCIFDKDNPDLSINTQDGNYSLRYDFKNLKEFSNNDIAICPENTAAISVGPHPIHLTDFFLNKSNLKLKGHSVMMGYLDQQLNNLSFKKDGFFIYF